MISVPHLTTTSGQKTNIPTALNSLGNSGYYKRGPANCNKNNTRSAIGVASEAGPPRVYIYIGSEQRAFNQLRLRCRSAENHLSFWHFDDFFEKLIISSPPSYITHHQYKS